jgi:sigma-E factor negative regulatory protein RseB
MTVVRLGRCGLLMVGLAVPFAHAATNPQELLVRMQHAANTLNYDGIFVYHRADQLESLRIIHKIGRSGVRERLVSLNGAPREVIRTDDEVRCYLPDENSVMVEHRRADQRTFPALLPDSMTGLVTHYSLNALNGSRVAGRTTQSVRIRPRDEYRYGYQLWADRDTGLLLMASLLDNRGAAVEQYMFTQVEIGGPIADADLAPQNRGKGLVWHRPEPGAAPAATARWQVGELPAGFVQTANMTRRLPNHRQPVEHLVYSDGLAVVSVFVEPVGDTATRVSGLTQIGAMHAYGRVVSGHQVTVVGEVPAATARMIGESVQLKP